MLRAGCIERIDIGSKFIIIAQINQTERRNKKGIRVQLKAN